MGRTLLRIAGGLALAAALSGTAMADAAADPQAAAWRTTGQDVPAWTLVSDPLAHVIAFAARNCFYLMPLLILVAIVVPIVRSSSKPRASAPAVIGFQPDPPRRTSRAWVLTPLLIVFTIVNLVFGSWWSTDLIYAVGAEGHATITGSHRTGTVHNERRVIGYDVLLKTADGRVVETSFDDDDFNVYPWHMSTRYPGKGDQFNVRYLVHFPKDFVILGEDDSPWAHDVRCSKLGGRRSEAESKLQFAPDVAAYRDAFDAASKAERAAGCE